LLAVARVGVVADAIILIHKQQLKKEIPYARYVLSSAFRLVLVCCRLFPLSSYLTFREKNFQTKPYKNKVVFNLEKMKL